MEAKLLKLQNEDSLSVMRKDIQDTISNLDQIWDCLSIDEQRNILHILIESIEITDDKIDIHYRI